MRKYGFIFQKEQILLQKKAEGGVDIPHWTDLSEFPLPTLRHHIIGVYNEYPCYAIEASEGEAPEGMVFESFRHCALLESDILFGLASRAKQILTWDRTTQFCSDCGHSVEKHQAEWAKQCGVCEALFYPTISPVVLGLIYKGDHILLARSPHFPPEVYSILAGFVETGETLEGALMREIREEVSLEVQNIQYVGSQPWPFPSNLMIGFSVEYKSGDIAIDAVEIEDAKWFSVRDLPVLPNPLSLSRQMIDAFVSQVLMKKND